MQRVARQGLCNSLTRARMCQSQNLAPHYRAAAAALADMDLPEPVVLAKVDDGNEDNRGRLRAGCGCHRLRLRFRAPQALRAAAASVHFHSLLTVSLPLPGCGCPPPPFAARRTCTTTRHTHPSYFSAATPTRKTSAPGMRTARRIRKAARIPAIARASTAGSSTAAVRTPVP